VLDVGGPSHLDVAVWMKGQLDVKKKNISVVKIKNQLTLSKNIYNTPNKSVLKY